MSTPQPAPHPVPLEIRERRARDLVERLAVAIARAGRGADIGDDEFLAPDVAERVRGLAAMYRELEVTTDSEWGDVGQVTAHFPDDRTAAVLLEVLADDRSIVHTPTATVHVNQQRRLLLQCDGLCRRIESLRIEAAA